MIGRRRERRAADRGVVAVLSVFFVLLLLTILAVVINLGRVMRTRGDLQHAADSAALAAAAALDSKATPTSGTAAPPGRTAADFDTGDGSVQAVASAYARSHLMMSEYEQRPTVDLTNDVTFGIWHLKSETCAFGGGMCNVGWEAAPTSLDPVQMFTVNAVSVVTHYPLPTIFDGLLGQGTRSMAARAIATTRRTRVPCALPFAVSVCQLVNSGGFACGPGGAPLDLEFTSADNSDPWNLLRIDVRGVNGESPPVLRDFVRDRTNQQCSLDPVGAEYPTGMSTGTDEMRPTIAPIVHGLLGIPINKGGHQSPGTCKLGRQYVIPVVQPAGVNVLSDCPVMPSQPLPPPDGSEGGGPWPPAGGQRVIGYVNFVATSVRCHYPSPTQVLTAANCETQMDATQPTQLLADNCAFVGSDAMGNDLDLDNRYIRIRAQISCDAPFGPPTDLTAKLLTRLVK